MGVVDVLVVSLPDSLKGCSAVPLDSVLVFTGVCVWNSLVMPALVSSFA